MKCDLYIYIAPCDVEQVPSLRIKVQDCMSYVFDLQSLMFWEYVFSESRFSNYSPDKVMISVSRSICLISCFQGSRCLDSCKLGVFVREFKDFCLRKFDEYKFPDVLRFVSFFMCKKQIALLDMSEVNVLPY